VTSRDDIAATSAPLDVNVTPAVLKIVGSDQDQTKR
jgi:hypothetical protein